MHSAWHILWLAWEAVLIVYVSLAIIAGYRLRDGAKKLNHGILIVMAILVLARIWIRHALGGQAYRLSVLFVGMAAGIATLIVARLLMKQAPAEQVEAIGSKERFQSLKLN